MYYIGDGDLNGEKLAEDFINYNVFCIKGLHVRGTGQFIEDLSQVTPNELEYGMEYLKNGNFHGLSVITDTLDANGVVKEQELYENGRLIKDNGENRKRVMNYYLNMDRISSESKRMIKNDFAKYKVKVSGVIKFFRGCFLFVLAIIFILGFIIYKIW